MSQKKVKTTKTKKAEKPNPKGEKIRKEFEFKLTKDEALAMFKKAQEHKREAFDLELTFEDEKTKWKSKITAQLAKANELASKADSGVEVRTLDAVMVKDYDAKEVKYFHKGECIETRVMKTEELQMDFSEARKAKIKNGRTKKDAGEVIAKVSGKKAKDTDIADVIRMETGKKTKTSSVDGARV